MRRIVHFYRRGWHRYRLRHYAAVLHLESCGWVRRYLSNVERHEKTDGWWRRFETAAAARRAAFRHNRQRGLDDRGVIPEGGCCR